MGGCASSKLDDSLALSLCRERCAFLDEAVRQRFALADAHFAYLHSLKSLALSLDRFFSQDSLDPPSSSPRKPGPSDHHHLHSLSLSHSGSDAHLDLGSDDDDDDHDHDHDDDASASDSLHHHDHDDHDHDHDAPSPLHTHLQQPPYADYFPVYGNPHLSHGGGPAAEGFMNINYMKNQPAPSLLYTQRPPIIPETLRMADSTPYFSNAMYSTANNHNPNPPYPIHNSSNFYNDYSNNYPNYGGGGGGGGFFAASSAPQPPQYDAGFSSLPGAMASTSKAPPPPPPSPPRASAWDFLNPFESFEKYYPTYTPSRDSREVREDEGIPDLEDEEDVVVKEVHGDQKFVDSARSSSYSKPGISEQDPARVVNEAELQYRARPSVGTETDPVEYEVHMVDKKVVDTEESSKDRGSASGFKPRGGFKGDSEVVREIKVQFERASDSGNELAKFLEVGKLPYKRKHAGHQVSSKILHLPVVSSQPSTSRGQDDNDPASLEIDKELELRSKTLSSTLHKLSLWEKKLCEEVKVEEKMRVLHERKSRKLKRLDEKGAEHQKVDTTRALVRSLSTKIKIAIQVVDKISVKINNLRDEELWPQLNEFIQGLTRMWKSMLECHHNQCEAITEAKRLDAIAIRKHFSDDHFKATQQLEHDLINWTLRFTYWVGAQKGFVRALNDWLMKCLLYVPEETPDGIVPFSPGRIGAPPVFVVCNQWWQSLDRISEKEVVDSMRAFASNVLQLWDRDKAEMRQRMLLTKDERKIKSLDKEEQKIQKEMQALDKRMMLISSDNNGMPITGHVVYQSETTKGGSLQASLQHVLEAMERFTASSLKVYEELVQRIEEDHLAGEPEVVS